MLNLLFVHNDYLKTLSERTVCVCEKEAIWCHVSLRFCDISMTNAPPVPVPLLHRCYSCNLWAQAVQVSLSLVIVDLSHIEELQLNTAYLPEGAITHCWAAKRSVMKQDKNTRMKHAPWPQTAHTSLIPMLTHFLCHVFWQKMTLDYINVILLDKNWCYPKGLKWLTISHRPVRIH